MKQAHKPTQQSLLSALATLPHGNILIVGDVMIDEYLSGDADRISPEAPVPVVLVNQESHVLGGAGNVAKNIVALGAKAFLVGVKGNDQHGLLLDEILTSQNIQAQLFALPDRPTTVKTRIVAQRQQMLRIDREVATPHNATLSNSILASIATQLPSVGAVVISDYGKGLVTQHFMQKLHKLIAKQKHSIPVLVDPKPINTRLYKGVSLLTPNTKETAEASHLPVNTPEQIKIAGQALMDQLHLPSLLTTLGPRGMAVFEKGKVWHVPTTAKRVFDVTGAGDTVIATTAMGLAVGHNLLESCMLANYAAGIVVGEVGAATASQAAVQDAIKNLPFTPPVEW